MMKGSGRRGSLFLLLLSHKKAGKENQVQETTQAKIEREQQDITSL